MVEDIVDSVGMSIARIRHLRIACVDSYTYVDRSRGPTTLFLLTGGLGPVRTVWWFLTGREID